MFQIAVDAPGEQHSWCSTLLEEEIQADAPSTQLEMCKMNTRADQKQGLWSAFNEQERMHSSEILWNRSLNIFELKKYISKPFEVVGETQEYFQPKKNSY